MCKLLHTVQGRRRRYWTAYSIRIYLYIWGLSPLFFYVLFTDHLLQCFQSPPIRYAVCLNVLKWRQSTRRCFLKKKNNEFWLPWIYCYVFSLQFVINIQFWSSLLAYSPISALFLLHFFSVCPIYLYYFLTRSICLHTYGCLMSMKQMAYLLIYTRNETQKISEPTEKNGANNNLLLCHWWR